MHSAYTKAFVDKLEPGLATGLLKESYFIFAISMALGLASR